MSRQWMTLMAILLVYIPVAIDATVLHVAAPTLSVALGSSGNELLWIIDIYSLVMAGMVLPMGALGDKIGFKRLLLLGSAIFGIASLCAALSPTAMTLIASRALLAVGAAMIVPATLAGIRSTFAEASQRNMALGLWAAVGSGGAAFGPLMLLCLFWKRTTYQGAIAGMVAGGAMVFFWKLVLKPLGGMFGIYELLPAFVFSVIVIVAVSLLTAEPDAQIEAEFDKVKAGKGLQ